jgi:hypothetical protein
MPIKPLVEILPFEVQIDHLINSLNNHVKKIGEPVFQGYEFGYNNFGGWNLQSRSGDYRDGFEIGVEKCKRKDGSFNYHLAKFINYSHPFEHKNKTQACTESISEVIDFLEEKGFYPRRMRLTVLKPNSKSIIHRDAPSNEYLARIHIPLITNEKCVHWTEYGQFQMPADGSVYMLWVNNLHQIRNDSDKDRYHIIVDAYDTKKITNNFHYNGNIQKLIDESIHYRKKIDEIKLSYVRKMFYSFAQKIIVHKFKKEQNKYII